jgi:hypothetical protein
MLQLEVIGNIGSDANNQTDSNDTVGKKDEEYRKIMETPDPIADNFLIDWEQRRYELSKAAMQGMISNWVEERTDKSYASNISNLCKMSIDIADAMIQELKSKQHDEQGIQDP